MFYVYVIQSLIDGSLYYGYTNDLKRRFQEHNQGFSVSTRSKRTWKLIYYEAFADKRDARIREK